MKLYTSVNIAPLQEPFRLRDRIVLLGSCFADNIGAKLRDAGFNVCVNPFGTLYNPSSIRKAVERLDGVELFTAADCKEMGAGAGRTCSFEHHTSFARATAEEFLENANAQLLAAREFWRSADRVIISLGTAFVWYADGCPVSNCLKRPAAEFERKMLSVSQIREELQAVIGGHPEKRFLLTVSPIRHMGDGAHANALSKSSLLLGADACVGAEYFPAYEIVNDELRDYRFYADDLVHPSSSAVTYIWERFLASCVAPSDLPLIKENERDAKKGAHRPILL